MKTISRQKRHLYRKLRYYKRIIRSELKGKLWEVLSILEEIFAVFTGANTRPALKTTGKTI